MQHPYNPWADNVDEGDYEEPEGENYEEVALDNDNYENVDDVILNQVYPARPPPTKTDHEMAPLSSTKASSPHQSRREAHKYITEGTGEDVDVDEELPLYEEIGDGGIYQDIPTEPYQPNIDDLILTTKPIANDDLALVGILPAKERDKLALVDVSGGKSRNHSARDVASDQMGSQGSAVSGMEPVRVKVRKKKREELSPAEIQYLKDIERQKRLEEERMMEPVMKAARPKEDTRRDSADSNMSKSTVISTPQAHISPVYKHRIPDKAFYQAKIQRRNSNKIPLNLGSQVFWQYHSSTAGALSKADPEIKKLMKAKPPRQDRKAYLTTRTRFELTPDILSDTESSMTVASWVYAEPFKYVTERGTDADDGGEFESLNIQPNILLSEMPFYRAVYSENRELIKGKDKPVRPKTPYTRDAWISVGSVVGSNGKNLYVRLTDDILEDELEVGTVFLQEFPPIKLTTISGILKPVKFVHAIRKIAQHKIYVPTSVDNDIKGIGKILVTSDTAAPKPDVIGQAKKKKIGPGLCKPLMRVVRIPQITTGLTIPKVKIGRVIQSTYYGLAPKTAFSKQRTVYRG